MVSHQFQYHTTTNQIVSSCKKMRDCNCHWKNGEEEEEEEKSCFPLEKIMKVLDPKAPRKHIGAST